MMSDSNRETGRVGQRMFPVSFMRNRLNLVLLLVVLFAGATACYQADLASGPAYSHIGIGLSEDAGVGEDGTSPLGILPVLCWFFLLAIPRCLGRLPLLPGRRVRPRLITYPALPQGPPRRA
ncbi:hypothetical protein C8D92_11027 [Tamilnaduibacter salinus]|uniref:Uncharacterized protein n=2 Tax=Tamilnaduibacter salinus TaxID=1484056 RepID=A0A2U1CTH6_9GAMM|nr:hypothetical protein C8D92_11027 [Tamilnaduibacter salinus]